MIRPHQSAPEGQNREKGVTKSEGAGAGQLLRGSTICPFGGRIANPSRVNALVRHGHRILLSATVSSAALSAVSQPILKPWAHSQAQVTRVGRGIDCRMAGRPPRTTSGRPSGVDPASCLGSAERAVQERSHLPPCDVRIGAVERPNRVTTERDAGGGDGVDVFLVDS